MRTVAVLFASLLAGPALAVEAAPARYAIDATLRPLEVSACGRYALSAEARVAPETRSADGRYTLKAVHVPAVGCDSFPDPLFSDGFEAP